MRRHSMRAAIAAALFGLGSVGVGLIRSQDPIRFPHEKHADLFPGECVSCHTGIAEPGQPIWPDPEACAACHDGTVKPRVDWRPRSTPRASNLKFEHARHLALQIECSQCHTESGTPAMTVRRASAGPCLDCHGVGPSHLTAPDDACSTCHIPLTEAKGLSRERVAAFPAPPSHEAPWVALAGHAAKASAAEKPAIPSSCATCHARDFCITCHVNAPEVPSIQALGPDERSLVVPTRVPAPPSHARREWITAHGREAGRSRTACATCHAKESCTTCHVGTVPAQVARLASPGPGRGPGVRTRRTKPASHTPAFVDRHGSDATARPSSCETCHVRKDCLDCHRPSPGGRGSGYHPDGFLTRHPASAYARDRNCSDCHNPAQFCQTCHQQSGLTAGGRLGPTGYHDGRAAFLLGHGQAARQQLESCVSCHTERDCTACHSAVGGGFRFSPHGPGFNPERMRKKNPSLCIACHGPGG